MKSKYLPDRMTCNRPAGSASNIRRRRTGCLTCRERRVRCGEEKPDCKNCSRRSRTCTWARDGDKFIHHRLDSAKETEELQKPSFQSGPELREPAPAVGAAKIAPDQLSADPAYSNGIFTYFQTPTTSSGSQTSTLVDQGSDFRRQDHGSPYQIADLAPRRTSSSSSDRVSAEELSCWRNEVFQTFTGESTSASNETASSICRSQSARLKDSIDLEHALTTPPNLEPNAEIFSDWHTLGASARVVAALEGDREMNLLQTYLSECAHWFDAVDDQRHYTRRSVGRMMACPPWRAAALALSAKYIELQQRCESTADSLSLHLYQLAVQLAIDSISGRFDCVGTTAGCVVLAVYEMMTVTYRDWRRHLRGCTSIYSHNHWNGDSMGLIQASFWNYARIDIWAAFCAGTETMLPSTSWFNQPEKVCQSVNLTQDRHAHVATWLLARVNNLVHSSKSSTDPNLDEEDLLHLEADLSTWERTGSTITKPIMQCDADQAADRPFPSILFSNESSVIAHVLWHTSMVLLLQLKCALHISTGVQSDLLARNIYEHSRMACGIVETNSQSPCVLVEAVHPLWICGRQLKTKSEKFAVLELLARIEHRTGWKTKWRSDSLREAWCLG